MAPEHRVRPGGMALRALIAAVLIVALWVAGRDNYLLFHALTETFGVVICAAVFLFYWSSRGDEEARPFGLLGIGYLFVGFIDVLHTLTYEGMTVLPTTHDYATKLWIAARALQALVTVVFALQLRLGKVAPTVPTFLIVGGATALLLASIFWWDIFPLCFVPGVGVTPFKKAAEYAISAVLALSAVLLPRRSLAPRVHGLLVGAFAANIASELVFTLYTSAYGYQNQIGHLLKVTSVYLAYQALFAIQVRSRIRLIQELGEAKAALEASEHDLRLADQSKDKFFSILAHDLRSPIGGLLNVSELLSKRFERLDASTVRRLADSIYDASLRSSQLLESVLHWARAHTGRLIPFPTAIRLAELSQGILSSNRAAAAAKGVRLRCLVPEEACVTADEDMVATVLRNLVSNAIKFTPSGGLVSIDATVDEGWQCLTVRDTGVGMSAEEVDQLFRIDTHMHRDGTASEPGNGLGLILCQELVALNRGEIRVSSEPGVGSVFAVRLPRD